HGAPRDLHSLPTRRSSDLSVRPFAWQTLTSFQAENDSMYLPYAFLIRWSWRLYSLVLGAWLWRPSRRERSTDSRIFTFARRAPRSEEHTSELQSRENLVCR